MIYRIAGLTVDMEPAGRTKQQAEAYRASACGAAADLSIRVDPRQALQWVPEAGSRDEAAYLVSGDQFAVGLLHHGGLMLHASAVVHRDRAVCFSAPPGIGKSTHARRWVRLFGAGILNDDKPALRRVDGTWHAFGTPWSGKLDLSCNREAPLHAICFLCRGERNLLTPLSPREALPLLLSQTNRLVLRESMELLLDHCGCLLREVPLWRFQCTNSDDAAVFARQRLFPES